MRSKKTKTATSPPQSFARKMILSRSVSFPSALLQTMDIRNPTIPTPNVTSAISAVASPLDITQVVPHTLQINSEYAQDAHHVSGCGRVVSNSEFVFHLETK